MNLFNLKNKLVWIVLSFILLMQSCAVYEKTPVTLAEAAASGHKVIIIDKDNTKHEIKKIEKINGVYYKVTNVDEVTVRIALDENKIKSVRVLNKTATTWLNIGIVVSSVVLILGIIAAVSLNNMDIGFDDSAGY